MQITPEDPCADNPEHWVYLRKKGDRIEKVIVK